MIFSCCAFLYQKFSPHSYKHSKDIVCFFLCSSVLFSISRHCASCLAVCVTVTHSLPHISRNWTYYGWVVLLVHCVFTFLRVEHWHAVISEPYRIYKCCSNQKKIDTIVINCFSFDVKTVNLWSVNLLTATTTAITVITSTVSPFRSYSMPCFIQRVLTVGPFYGWKC